MSGLYCLLSGTIGGFDAWPTVNAVIRTTWLLVATAIYVFIVFGTLCLLTKSCQRYKIALFGKCVFFLGFLYRQYVVEKIPHLVEGCWRFNPQLLIIPFVCIFEWPYKIYHGFGFGNFGLIVYCFQHQGEPYLKGIRKPVHFEGRPIPLCR